MTDLIAEIIARIEAERAQADADIAAGGDVHTCNAYKSGLAKAVEIIREAAK